MSLTPAGRKVKGRRGIRIPGGTLFGGWLSSQAYEVGDAVTRSDVLYRCILGHTNQQPPNATYWTALLTGGAGGYTDENAQDAIGTILVDDDTLDFTYDDATPSITAVVKGVRESGGTKLTMGAVADGQVLKRSGSTLIGVYAALALTTLGNILELTGPSSVVSAITTTAGTVA